MARAPYMHEDFCLETKTAVRLYREFAEPMPILDYHCHLPAGPLADDERFANLTRVWLAGDHYKWRAMRIDGVDERLITGGASDREKFDAWAATVPRCLRNPLYVWTHLELKKPFGIVDRLLSPETADSVWEECNEQLGQPAFSARGMLRQWRVVLAATTDDPADSLDAHRRIAADPAMEAKVVPTLRPDRGMAVENAEAFRAWVEKLAAAAGAEIRTWTDYREALRRRIDFFHEAGCRISDHGLERPYAEECGEAEAGRIFAAAREGRRIGPDDAAKFRSAMLVELGRMYHAKGWVQQYHFGALRNTNTRMMHLLGPDSGFDTIGDFEIARPLARLLDRLDREDRLPRTILYNLNPRDNELLSTMAGCFQDGSVPGKIQFGSGWWFLDQKDGMEKQLDALSNMGLLSRFVGMLTDSRSFLSYSRHEYFRRILCNMLGNDIEKGLLPRDIGLAGAMVRDVSYRNAASWFGFDVPPA